MNLPKWLVIVGIALIVLGVLACGIGVARSEPAPGKDASPQPAWNWDRIPVFAVQAPEIVMSGACSAEPVTPAPSPPATPRTRFRGTGCVLTVTPAPPPWPHELRLRVETGSGSFRVEQELRGKLQRSDAESLPPPARTLAVRVTGSTVTTRITCLPSECRLVVSE